MHNPPVDQMEPNLFKQRILANERQLGVWSSLASNIVTEIISYSDFDWVVLDGEHAPNEVTGFLPQLQSLRGSPVHPVVRPAFNDYVLIKRLADIGFRSFLIPFVQSAEEAAKAVAATRYPPEGIRGVAVAMRASKYGHVKTYAQTENEQICVLVQIETQKSLDALEDIAKVPGIDGVFVGPSDLAASLGHTGNAAHPEVQDAIREVAKTCAKTGKTTGILAFSEEDANRYLGWGFRFVALGSDAGFLKAGLAAAVARHGK